MSHRPMTNTSSLKIAAAYCTYSIAVADEYKLCTVKNAVELLGAFRPDVEKIQYH